ncbi:hypothetical protein [Lactobacillus helveticus]|uniref:hypothetical protein n=1 Tax=Lactobacillus helveticus TaxID=1587 RepID=UPI001565CEC5|nr:hypothetical protein [Lactobacillus helveticus]NRO94122.1 hypothetical protein [Lactobacillus helveticus]
MVGIIPRNGGGEFAFGKVLKKGAILFGLQRVPSVARLVEYGKTVCATGYRDKLYAVAIPKNHTQEICNVISTGFNMPCLRLPDYLNLTLTPSTSILHTTRLYTLFKNYIPNKTVNKKFHSFMRSGIMRLRNYFLDVMKKFKSCVVL